MDRTSEEGEHRNSPSCSFLGQDCQHHGVITNPTVWMASVSAEGDSSHLPHLHIIRGLFALFYFFKIHWLIGFFYSLLAHSPTNNFRSGLNNMLKRARAHSCTPFLRRLSPGPIHLLSAGIWKLFLHSHTYTSW